jgi:hypothetical protein
MSSLYYVLNYLLKTQLDKVMPLPLLSIYLVNPRHLQLSHIQAKAASSKVFVA